MLNTLLFGPDQSGIDGRQVRRGLRECEKQP